MKIATYKDGSRDGQLVVVSRDLSLAHYATGIVGRMQQLLDDWNFLSPQLEELSQTVNHGKARHAFAFDAALCMAPLPRAHLVALAAAPAATSHGSQATQLRIVRGDALLGPRDAMPLSADPGLAGEQAEPVADLDFCGQLALIIGDLAAGTAADEALASIRLVTLASSWHRADADDRSRVLDIGSISFAPVAATPDELGAAWSNGRIGLHLEVQRGARRFGRCPTADESGRPIGEALAACARNVGLRSGAIVGIGMPTADGSVGDFSIAGRRLRELDLDGAAHTAYLHRGESLRLDAIGPDGASVFGAIEPMPAPI